MCTLSWFRDSEVFELHFNRDERHSRAEAGPPRRSRSGALSVLAPRDGDHGGSWIGVNERGLTLALLNGWHLRAVERPDFRSRGLLVLDALGHDSLADLRSALGASVLERYRPFTLCAFEPGAEPLRADWDGRHLSLGRLEDAERPLVSSSYRFEDVAERRRTLFAQLAGAAPGRAELARFHASHLPERGPFSTCMHRDDASTKSYTVVHVAPGRAEMAYLDAAPCEGGALHSAELELRPATAR